MKAVRTVCGALALLFVASAAGADKGRSEGVFTDAAGKQHPWQVTRSHALLWDGQPYAPAGVVFRSRYLARPSDATFQEDRASIDRLKAAGVRDLRVEPGRGLLACSTEEIQRFIDLLETSEMRYGIGVRDRAASSFTGYAPGQTVAIPAVAVKPGARFQWSTRVQGARRVHYALVDADIDWTAATGSVTPENGVATIDTVLKNTRSLNHARLVLHVVHEKEFPAGEAGTFPDLWGAMDAYQQKVTTALKRVKFGPGLRFIADPLDAASGVEGVESSVFPKSQEFKAAFIDWISRSRLNITDLNLRWGLTQTHIPSLEIAGRLVPTWPKENPPEKFGWLIDPVGDTAYQVVPSRCRIWDDYTSVRADGLKRAMGRVAGAIKTAGPSVPVIYTWSGYQKLYATQGFATAYDGIAASLSGCGSALATDQGAYAFAQAEESSQSWWLIAGCLMRTEQPAGAAPGTASLLQDWQALRDVGFKGLYLELPASADETSLASLKEISTSMESDRDLAVYQPRTCFFPAFIPNAGRVTRLPNGVWWLPSMGRARLLQLGDKLNGYQIEYPFGDDVTQVRSALILWSPTGAQTATFSVEPDKPVAILDSGRKPVKTRMTKQGLLKLTLTDTPLIAIGMDANLAFPFEAATSLVQELDALLKEAEAQGMETKAARQLHKDAVSMLQPPTALHVYNLVNRSVTVMRDLLSPYLWVEGERPLDHTFGGTVFQTGLSEGRYLQLDRAVPSPSGGFQVRYPVTIRKEATYEIWVAGTVPGRGGVSPIQWRMDADPPATLSNATPAGADYATGFCWYSLGSVTLTKGKHVLTIEVPEKGAGSGRFLYGIDSVLFSRGPFQPRGTEKPDWRMVPKNAGSNVAARP